MTSTILSLSSTLFISSSLHFSTPNLCPNRNPKLVISRKSSLRCSHACSVRTVACISNGNEINPGTASSSDDSNKESSINLNLPRRRLLVQFTCNACGERTKRLINRLAYERGTVFLQCAGCLQHHKLVDNLGLVVEHDFRNDTDQEL